MITGVDTDVLVNWLMTGAPYHGACRDFISKELRQRGNLLGLTIQTLLEFLHICTDPRRFEKPLEVTEGLEWVRSLWNGKEVVRILPTETVALRTVELMERLQFGRKRILDIALAATLEAAGVRRFATLNARDFAGFSFLEVITPADS